MRRSLKLCRKYGVLVKVRDGREVISTYRLHAVLGEKLYQKCREGFQYHGNYPSAAQVEEFLRSWKNAAS